MQSLPHVIPSNQRMILLLPWGEGRDEGERELGNCQLNFVGQPRNHNLATHYADAKTFIPESHIFKNPNRRQLAPDGCLLGGSGSVPADCRGQDGPVPRV